MSRLIYEKIPTIKNYLKAPGFGQDSLGWWWNPDIITKICNDLNLKCMVLEQDKNLPYTETRFSILIRK